MYSTEFRALDVRLGRWFIPDPITHPWQSPYCAMDNDPIGLTDVLGLSSSGNPGRNRKGTYQKQIKISGKTLVFKVSTEDLQIVIVERKILGIVVAKKEITLRTTRSENGKITYSLQLLEPMTCKQKGGKLIEILKRKYGNKYRETIKTYLAQNSINDQELLDGEVFGVPLKEIIKEVLDKDPKLKLRIVGNHGQDKVSTYSEDERIKARRDHGKHFINDKPWIDGEYMFYNEISFTKGGNEDFNRSIIFTGTEKEFMQERANFINQEYFDGKGMAITSYDYFDDLKTNGLFPNIFKLDQPGQSPMGITIFFDLDQVQFLPVKSEENFESHCSVRFLEP